MVLAFRWIPRCVRPRSWSGTAVLSSSEVGDRRPQPRNRQGRTIHALEITGTGWFDSKSIGLSENLGENHGKLPNPSVHHSLSLLKLPFGGPQFEANPLKPRLRMDCDS